jgi:hypothetical protein
MSFVVGGGVGVGWGGWGGGQASWAKMTSPWGELTPLIKQKVNKAEELT